MFLDAADMLFDALSDRMPADVEEHALSLQALVWYAAHTEEAERKSSAVSKIGSVGDSLKDMALMGVLEGAFGVRGLIEAHRTTGNVDYLTAAADAFGKLEHHFDPATGIFDDKSSYKVDDIAVILGALNAARIFAGDAIDQSSAETIFTAFFESAVNKSGLQLSAPPKDVAKGDFEKNSPDIFYAYPGIKPPPAAGGDFGVAPVFAGEVTFTNGNWQITDSRFDSAGAMHAANEMIWFHVDEVNGFPTI